MQAPNQPPVAEFVWELDLEAGQLRLDASGSHDPDGHVEFYDWYIATANHDEVAEGEQITHPIDVDDGPWTVTLFVVDDEGASGQQRSFSGCDAVRHVPARGPGESRRP